MYNVANMSLQQIDWQAVYTYYISNEKISYADCASHFNISIDSVKKKGSEKNWTSKKQEILKAALNLTEHRTINEIAERNTEHAKMGRAIQGVALEALATSEYKPKSFDDIRKGLETGIKIERTALGMDQRIYGKVYIDTPQIKYHVVWGDGSELNEY